jgi:Spy/CpxP family protein refolding chaperone
MQSFAKNLTMHEAGCECRNGWSRRAGQRLRTGLRLALFFALACGLAGNSQSPSGAAQSPMGPPFYGRQDMGSPYDYDPILEEKRLRMLNIERQKQMVADANKLLKLAKELNDEVAASNADTLTAEQLHKIAEIEKLARNVKDRMSATTMQLRPVLARPGFVYPVP